MTEINQALLIQFPQNPLPLRVPDRLHLLRVIAFALVAAICLTGRASPAAALGAGLLLALTLENPFPARSKALSKFLLQGCVVLLGFGMDLHTVLRAGEGGFLFAAGTIASTLALGWGIGRLMHIAPRTSLLISVGTAICGGSAIAAVGSVIGGAEAEMTVALGTVFILNAVALYLFPLLGHAMHLSQAQFGTWAGVAIHDVSSVVGAAARFGVPALQIATAVKLSRSLWIVPVSIAAAIAYRSPLPASENPTGKRPIPRLQLPWFIGLFILASVARSIFPAIAQVAPQITHAATIGLTLTLFLIGSGLSRATLQRVGWRPMVQGMILWLFIATASLLVIRQTIL